MADADRPRLIAGPYAAPECAAGDLIHCHLRRKPIRVDGFTVAPIPWPFGGGGRGQRLIVADELRRAIFVESAVAVEAHWGVGRGTASNWRVFFKVGETPGTRRARESVTPPRRPVAPRHHAWTPEEDALLGTVTDREVARRLGVAPVIILNRRKFLGIPRCPAPKGEAWTGPRWRPSDDALLGSATDEEVAHRLGKSRSTISMRRNKLKIPAFRPRGGKP